MFGERLKELRTNFNMLQKDLADLLKVSPSTIGMYERGQRDPDTDTIKFLAKYFNVTSDWLLGLSDDRHSKDVSLEKNYGIETRVFHYKGTEGLPEEAIKQIEDYIELIKLKYNPDRTLKKKDNENEKKPE
ncbi:MAG: helix-turn-helix domain-containing protein [Bacillota bacterium]